MTTVNANSANAHPTQKDPLAGLAQEIVGGGQSVSVEKYASPVGTDKATTDAANNANRAILKSEETVATARGELAEWLPDMLKGNAIAGWIKEGASLIMDTIGKAWMIAFTEKQLDHKIAMDEAKMAYAVETQSDLDNLQNKVVDAQITNAEDKNELADKMHERETNAKLADSQIKADAAVKVAGKKYMALRLGQYSTGTAARRVRV